MARGINVLAVAIMAGIEAFGSTALSVLTQQQPDDEACAHANTETMPGSTMGNVRTRCRDCGKELDQ